MMKNSESGEESGADSYEVEEVVDKRTIEGRVQYRVQWKGYPLSESTWEPSNHLANAQEAVSLYELKECARKKQAQRPIFCAFDAVNDLEDSDCSDRGLERDSEIAKPRKRRDGKTEFSAKTGEDQDLEVLEVRERAGTLVWTVETQGQHIEMTLDQLKRRAPGAVIDFLVSKLRFT